MTPAQKSALRTLPSVDQFLSKPSVRPLVDEFGRDPVTESVRSVLAEQRSLILADAPQTDIENEVRNVLKMHFSPTLVPVINATGVIIHTNLGRAPLSQSALSAIETIGSGYSNLEFDMTTGGRGSRSTHAAQLLTRLTGAEAATVVNNAASATVIMLAALAEGRDVIISRGQLVEIGGGFRMPDVMRQAGVNLVEVGTTNRTHLRDYANAITENTGAILVVHHSNFKIIGFTTEPSIKELADLAHSHNIPLLYDQGSGALKDVTEFGLKPEPMVQESVSAGADVIVFSGDKLLGGPQAGLVVGSEPAVSKIKRYPLARAIRPGKLTYSALMATLTEYAQGRAIENIPVWQMMSKSVEEIEKTAKSWRRKLRSAGVECEVIDGFSAVGGGTTPGQVLPTKLLVLDNPNPDQIAEKLRQATPAVIGIIQNGRLSLDPRTVFESQAPNLIHTLTN